MSTERSQRESNSGPPAGYNTLQRKTLRILLAVGFVSLVFAIILREVTFVRCFVLGLALGLLNFKILGRSVEVATARGVGKASRGAVKYFLIRFLLVAFGLVLVVGFGAASIAAFLVGFFLPHIVLACTLVRSGRSKQGSATDSGTD